jgi:hypothetical protein
VIFYWILVMRHMIRLFELRPHLRPPPLPPAADAVGNHKIALSEAQSSQIREIFELFDTDGGGSIDRGELDFAMVALGFQKTRKQRQRVARSRRTESGVLEQIIEDGTVTLDEFTALMTGELSGRDPMETLRAVFSLLCGGEAQAQAVESSAITLDSLAEACKKYEVLVRTRTHVRARAHASMHAHTVSFQYNTQKHHRQVSAYLALYCIDRWRPLSPT